VTRVSVQEIRRQLLADLGVGPARVAWIGERLHITLTWLESLKERGALRDRVREYGGSTPTPGVSAGRTPGYTATSRWTSTCRDTQDGLE
jgi:hypothetical protein